MATNPNELPPYVKFVIRPVEDRTCLLESGKWGYKDVVIAQITRPGQRDTHEAEPEAWLAQLQKRSADGLVPDTWYAHFKRQYEAWKEGLEIPTEGTPIRGWTVALPAQQENLILLGFRTVEELAAADEVAIQRIGLGGARLRDLARNWLVAAADTGIAAAKMEALQVQNAALQEQLRAQAERLKALEAKLQPLAA
jgi:hypothetical protein